MLVQTPVRIIQRFSGLQQALEALYASNHWPVKCRCKASSKINMGIQRPVTAFGDKKRSTDERIAWAAASVSRSAHVRSLSSVEQAVDSDFAFPTLP